MSVKIISATLEALDARLVDVEVDVSSGLPATVIVGLPDVSIRESKVRVRACLRQMAPYRFPLGRISINLSPADLFKYGTHFDLSIALGILLASRQIKFNPAHKIFLGELSLDGRVCAVRGILAFVHAARQAGCDQAFVPIENAFEAMLVDGIKIIPISTLADAITGLQGRAVPQISRAQVEQGGLGVGAGSVQITAQASGDTAVETEDSLSFSAITGQEFAKRGLEIAVAGGHNILLSGPPGAGKTMLAQATLSILPDATAEQSLEIMKIHSIAGTLQQTGMLAKRIKPFRAPHHSITEQAFIGGGRIPRPGEISLAHNGILFMDEFPEFPRAIIESLRQPLEYGRIRIARVLSHYVFPANFILIAAQNPCPCGYYQDLHRRCICTVPQIISYRKRISGPILDRIDLQITVQAVDVQNISEQPGESSAEIIKRINFARAAQISRQGTVLNSRLGQNEVRKYCILDKQGLSLVHQASEQFHFSMRTYIKILKTARTIADLAGAKDLGPAHIAESIGYRLYEAVPDSLSDGML